VSHKKNAIKKLQSTLVMQIHVVKGAVFKMEMSTLAFVPATRMEKTALEWVDLVTLTRVRTKERAYHWKVETTFATASTITH
jgi:hypothetical protein